MRQLICFVILCLLIPVVAIGQYRRPRPSSPAWKVSASNRKPAKTAFAAVSEIDSVLSTRPNYYELANSIQTAKIKFDAAMRDFVPKTTGDRLLVIEFSNLWTCYLDLKEAWSDFVEHGANSSDLDPNYNDVVIKLGETYGFKGQIRSLYSSEPPYVTEAYLYSRDEVLQAILLHASLNRTILKVRVKGLEK